MFGWLRRFLYSGTDDTSLSAGNAAGNEADLADPDLSIQHRHTDDLLAEGNNAMETGNYTQAIEAFKQALRLDSGNATIHFLASEAYRKQGAFTDCEDSLKLATSFDPDLYQAHLSLGNIFLQQNEYEKAAASYLRALEGINDDAGLYCNLGLALFPQGKNDEAEHYFRRGLALDADHPLILNNLAVLLCEEGRTQEAFEFIERAVTISPDYENANITYVSALRDMGRIDEAIRHIDDYIAMAGESPAMHWQKSLTLLVSGRFAEGWNEYEWGFALGERPDRAFPYAPWDGSSLEGKTILVYGEQGLGDEIIFASCLPDVIGDAGKVIVECDKRLEKLFSRSFPEAIIHGGERNDSMAWLSNETDIDLQIPAGSLPLHYRRTWQDFPAHDGYLTADTMRKRYWQGRLESLGTGLKIGISWQGGTRKTRQNLRSIKLAEWEPLFSLQGVHFISLQYTDVSEELSRLYDEKDIQLNHWQEAIDDYDETAALVSALDLVISVQTAVVDLAGAIGQEAWVLLPEITEWRYLREGEKLPWYPSVRLFRRHRNAGWKEVISEVSMCLQDRIQKQPS